MSSNTKAFEEKMKSSVEHLDRELAAVRAGRANPAVLDKVSVDYYGAPTPIQQVASVAVSEARTLTITPWDRTLLRAISKAIMASDVGITPIDDGSTIRLNFPAPTEERRKQLAKEVAKLGEEAKVAVRNVRRDAMDKAKAMKKAGELTEDTQKTMEEEVQKLTDKYIKNIDAAVRKSRRRSCPSDRRGETKRVRCRALERVRGTFCRNRGREHPAPQTQENDYEPSQRICRGPFHRHHHGRQRPLGQAAGPAPHRGPQKGCRRISGYRQLLRGAGRFVRDLLRLLYRELEAPVGRGLRHYEAVRRVSAQGLQL